MPTPEGGRRYAWTRVVRGRADAVADRLSTPLAGALTAGWSAVLTLLGVGALIVFSWVLGAGSGSITDIMSVTGIAWLACHLVPISIEDGTISALPLGLVIIPGWQLWRAGRWATRRSGACQWSDIRPIAGIGAAVYATVALIVATSTATPAASVEPIWAVLGTGVFALFVFGGGASREAGLWPSVADRVSRTFRQRIRAASVGLLTVVAFGALLFGVSLAWHFSTSMTLMEVLSPGLIGNLLLFALSLAYLPNILIWSGSFVLGAGFAVGDGTQVSPFGIDASGLPSFPLLAAVPEQAPPGMIAVLLVPLIAGALSTWCIRRTNPMRIRDIVDLRERIWIAGIAAVVVVFACWLSMGSLGTGRMAVLGPSPLIAGFNAFVLLFVGGVVGDAIRQLVLKGRHRWIDVRDPADDRADRLSA